MTPPMAEQGTREGMAIAMDALREAERRFRHIAEDFAEPDDIADDPEEYGGTDDGLETVCMAYENMQHIARIGAEQAGAALRTLDTSRETDRG